MDKNKSIDGLKPRRSSKAATVADKSSSVSTYKTAKITKTSSVKRVKSPKSKQIKPSAPSSSSIHKSQTATPIPPSTQKSKPTPAPSRADIAKDFLSPTQVFDFDDVSGELKAAATTSPNSQTTQKAKKSKKEKKQKKSMSKKRKIIIIIIVLLLLIIGSVVGFIIWGKLRLENMGISGSIFDLISETYTPLKTDSSGRTNILAFGTSGYDMDGNEGDGVHDGAQLTDSIMVISLDQETGDAAMLSLPRDLKASPTCTATGKINEVYWCNNMDGTNEQAGAEALITEVSDILGIDFQYYVHINWGSLVQIVDAIGGITITLDEDIADYEYTGAVFNAGVEYTIDGEQALGLARARHGTASGDFSRGASQQKILIGIKDKILASQLGIPELLGLFDTLSNNLKVNFESSEIKTLAHLLTDLDIANARQVSLIEPAPFMTTGTINGISYVFPSAGVGNYLAIQNYVAKMFSGDPRAYEDYTILVLNATDIPGLASSEQIALTDEGYDNIDVDDAPADEYADGYTLYALTDTAPETRKLLEEKYSITARPIDTLPPTISTDYDFVLIINTKPSAQE